MPLMVHGMYPTWLNGESQGCPPDSGNSTVRDETWACGNVSYGGTMNPPHIPKGCVSETLCLQAARAAILSRPLLFPERIIICPKGMTIITWGVGQVIVSVDENLRPNLI